MTFMPAATTCSSIDARAPLPTATIVTTAPTPIVMPTSVERRPQRISPQRLRRELEGLTARHYATSDTGGGSCSSSSLASRDMAFGASDTMRPSRKLMMRVPYSAIWCSCVMTMTVMPRSRWSCLKDLHHLDARPRIEVARRLVRKQDRRLGHQRARDRHALLLTARQLIRMMMRAVGKPDRGKRRHRLLPPLAHRTLVAVVEQRQLHVLDGRRSRQQVEALKHEPDRRVPHVRELVPRQRRDVAAVQHVAPARRLVEAAEDVHESGLSGSRRSHDRHELAGLISSDT